MSWRPKRPCPTWRSFLQNHVADTATVDMCVVATATFKLLYAVIVLDHQRRRVIHFDVTQHQPKPGSCVKSPRPCLGTLHLAIYYETAIHPMPSASAIVFERWASRERIIGSVRRECLDRMII